MIILLFMQSNKMRQQIRNWRLQRKHNQDQLFMYYRSPKLDNPQGYIYRSRLANSGRIVQNNPERYTIQVYERWSPLRGYYKVCSSLDHKSSRVGRLPILPLRQSKSRFDIQQQTKVLGSQQILAERARQFINRLRKQRQYDHGKAVIRKKKEEDHRKIKERQEAKLRANYEKFIKEHRVNKLTDSILYHQERICQRLRNSISRYRLSSLRSKTQEIPQSSNSKMNQSQNAQFEQMDPAQSKVEFPPVTNLQSKYKS